MGGRQTNAGLRDRRIVMQTARSTNRRTDGQTYILRHRLRPRRDRDRDRDRVGDKNRDRDRERENRWMNSGKSEKKPKVTERNYN